MRSPVSTASTEIGLRSSDAAPRSRANSARVGKRVRALLFSRAFLLSRGTGDVAAHDHRIAAVTIEPMSAQSRRMIASVTPVRFREVTNSASARRSISSRCGCPSDRVSTRLL